MLWQEDRRAVKKTRGGMVATPRKQLSERIQKKETPLYVICLQQQKDAELLCNLYTHLIERHSNKIFNN